MKKFNLYILLFVFCISAGQLNAQDGYTYTLMHNGGYSFTVQAVPNASSNNFATSVQSYGFTLTIPDGVTITTDSSLGSSSNVTFFDGTSVGMSAIDGYLVTETLGAPASLAAPSAGTNSNMFTFTVNGTPTSGELRILENNSALATTVTALKSFMQADMIDNGMAEFVNVVDPNAAAVSGMSTFGFATLSVDEVETISPEIEVYPNPTSSIVNIQSNIEIDSIEIYNLLGKKIAEYDTQMQSVDFTPYASGIYLLNLYHKDKKVVKRIVKD